jgi:hypothetical protein
MRLNALCLLAPWQLWQSRSPQEQYRLSRQGRDPLSGAVKQPSPLHKASRPLTSVLLAIIGNQAAMPHTAILASSLRAPLVSSA